MGGLRGDVRLGLGLRGNLQDDLRGDVCLGPGLRGLRGGKNGNNREKVRPCLQGWTNVGPLCFKELSHKRFYDDALFHCSYDRATKAVPHLIRIPDILKLYSDYLNFRTLIKRETSFFLDATFNNGTGQWTRLSDNQPVEIPTQIRSIPKHCKSGSTMIWHPFEKSEKHPFGFLKCEDRHVQSHAICIFDLIKGEFQTDGYPVSYPVSIIREWNLQAPPNQRIKVTFEDMAIECDCGTCIAMHLSNYCFADCNAVEACTACAFDFVKVYDGSSDAAPLMITVCGVHKNLELVSTGNSMYILFNADDSFVYKGFKASYISFL